MRLLREIAELSVSDSEPLGNVLRKCMILNATLKNEELGLWLKQELNGYDTVASLPDYRVIRTQAKGHFSGPMGASINYAPLPSVVMKSEHRHWAVSANLMQSVASFDELVRSKNTQTMKMPWPQDLVVFYQGDFYRGYALVEAWLELPMSAIIALCDTVRNRVLEFTLKVDETLDGYGDNASAMPQEKVTQFVTNIIHGNNNVIAGNARDITNASSKVRIDNFEDIAKILSMIGASRSDTDGLREAVSVDKQNGEEGTIGPKTSSWLAGMLIKAGKGGLNVGVDVAGSALTEGLKGYLGL